MKKRAVFSLVSLLLLSPWAGAAEGSEKMKGVSAEWNQLYKKWVAEYQAAETDEARKLARKNRPRPGPHIDQMVALMKEHRAEASTMKHVPWVLRLSGGTLPEGVIDILEQHKSAAELAEVVPYLAWSDKGSAERELFDWARKNSPHQGVKAMAAYANAMTEELPAEETKSELQFARDHGGEVEYRGRAVSEMAGNALFAAENLAVGKVAPEIEGEDLHGVPFKLSDYRGKVVVLDFWGHW